MTEQPKKEISIKMPGDEKPLAAIIEGRKRRVQRQYCTFLNNKKDARAEQAISQPQKLLRAESPGKPFIHHASSSDNLLKPPQGKSEAIPAEGQEDWIEEDEDEQLDYEPSVDDQNALLEAGEQGDWTKEYGEEQMEYDGERDAKTEAFGAELEDLLQGDLGINMVFILPEKFRAAEGQ
ncbi:unnamed protein product [Prunus armeniaca]